MAYPFSGFSWCLMAPVKIVLLYHHLTVFNLSWAAARIYNLQGFFFFLKEKETAKACL